MHLRKHGHHAEVLHNLDRDSTAIRLGGRLQGRQCLSPGRKHDEMQDLRGEAILTAIDKPVVVLLECFGSVAFLLEGDVSDTFRASIGIVMKGDFLEWADRLTEQVLKRRLDLRIKRMQLRD